MIVYTMSGRFIVNLGGTAEVTKLLSLFIGIKAFFIIFSYKLLHRIKKILKRRMKNMSKGRFGIHGGQYIPETLMNAVIELEEAYNHFKKIPNLLMN